MNQPELFFEDAMPVPGELWQVVEGEIRALHRLSRHRIETYAIYEDAMFFVIDADPDLIIIWCDGKRFEIETHKWWEWRIEEDILQRISPSEAA